MKIASIVLVAVGAAVSNALNCTTVTGVEYYHEDIQKVAASTADQCCSSCVSLPGCSHFTFEPSEVGQSHDCYLKSGNSTVNRKDGAVSGWCNHKNPGSPVNATIQLESSAPIGSTETFYSGWNIDTSANRGFFERDIGSNNPELQYLAAQLKPSVLRCGGTGNDHIDYCGFNASSGIAGVPSGSESPDGNLCLNTTWWDNLASLSKSSEATLVFGLNILKRTSGGDWDSAQAEQLLRYAMAKGDSIWGLELGNEEDDHLSVEQTVDGFVALQQLVSKLYANPESNPNGLPAPKLLGPDPHSLHSSSGLPSDHDFQFLIAFAKASESSHPGMMTGITHHEYTELTADDAMNPDFLDNTYRIGRQVVDAVNAASMAGRRESRSSSSSSSSSSMTTPTSMLDAPLPRVWAGEIAGHNGGGVVGFAGMLRHSFWYADALGAKAKAGYGAFCRQDLIGASYGLLSDSFEVEVEAGAAGAAGQRRSFSDTPGVSKITVHPDYWVNLLFSKVMGSNVFNGTATGAPSVNGYLRPYIHSCAASGGESNSGIMSGFGGTPGCLALVIVNVDQSTSFSVQLPEVGASHARTGLRGGENAATPWKVWALTAVDGAGLDVPRVALNGKELVRSSSGQLPSVDPSMMAPPASRRIAVPPASIVFLQIES